MNLPGILLNIVLYGFLCGTAWLLLCAYACEAWYQMNPENRRNPMRPLWRWWAFVFWAVFLVLVFKWPR
jgi:hypothetical protein